MLIHSLLYKGFYKLLSITFKNCEVLNYFQGISEAPAREDRAEGTQAVILLLPFLFLRYGLIVLLVGQQESSGEVVIVQDDLENKRVSMMLFKKFIAEILVRIQQYKDELLAACIGTHAILLAAVVSCSAEDCRVVNSRIVALRAQAIRAAGPTGSCNSNGV